MALTAGCESPPAAGLAARLAAALDSMSLAVEASRQRRLLEYLAMLERWNRTFNLTAVREPGQMVARHLVDSLSVLPLIERLVPPGPASMVDVGSGAGLPGIPLAIVRDAWSWSLVESNGKKAAFLRQCVGTLGLASAQVRHCRVEAVERGSLPGGGADLIVARAFSSVQRFIDAVSALIGPHTVVLAMKGRAVSEELRRLDQSGSLPEWSGSHRLFTERIVAPDASGDRYAVVLAPDR